MRNIRPVIINKQSVHPSHFVFFNLKCWGIFGAFSLNLLNINCLEKNLTEKKELLVKIVIGRDKNMVLSSKLPP